MPGHNQHRGGSSSPVQAGQGQSCLIKVNQAFDRINHRATETPGHPLSPLPLCLCALCGGKSEFACAPRSKQAGQTQSNQVKPSQASESFDSDKSRAGQVRPSPSQSHQIKVNQAWLPRHSPKRRWIKPLKTSGHQKSPCPRTKEPVWSLRLEVSLNFGF